jgi:multimeric flavodoxin WrbA
MAESLGADAGAGLKALGVNCTLKKSPDTSHTEALMNRVLEILGEHCVETEILRPVDFNVKFGVTSDEGDGDEWPQILDKIKAADILLIGMSIWFGVRSSVCQMVIERLDGTYNSTNAVGQYPMYNKVGGVVVTGNEDGGKHCAAQMLYALSHIGFTIPPQVDAYWNGEAGPGPSYLDDDRGSRNHWMTRNAVFAAWNMLHTARRLKDDGGVPAHGNVTTNWDLSDPEHPNPEYR